MSYGGSSFTRKTGYLPDFPSSFTLLNLMNFSIIAGPRQHTGNLQAFNSLNYIKHKIKYRQRIGKIYSSL